MSLLFSCCAMFGQQTGQIVGMAVDATGAAVANATVRAIEVGTGFVRSTVTGAEGQYVLAAMRPAAYTIEAEAPGFRGFRRTGLELLANQSLTVSIALEVGSVTETVNVAGAATQVDTSTSTLIEVIDRSRIIELPLNGRDAATLATLVPGTSVISVSRESGKSIPGGLQLASNGTGTRQVSFRLDGAANTDTYYQENQTFPFPDALQEFSIQTSNYSAVHGNTAGAMVNVVTKSGTNSLHGGAFEFVRNRVFNARNFFSPERDRLQRNQMGGYLGGPLIRNKTFLFGGWQGTRIRNRGNNLNTFAPTSDQRRGNFSTCGAPCNRVLRDPLGGNFPNNVIPVSRFDPAAVKVNALIPEVGGDGFLSIPRPIKHQLDQGIIKGDHQFTDADRLSIRYFIDHFSNAGTFDPSNLLSYRNPTLASRVRSQSGMVNWTHIISPAILNETRFGFTRIHAARGPFFEGVPSMQSLGVRLPLYPTLPSISQIEAQGFFNIGDNLEAKFPRTAFEVANRTGWIRGKHSMQFGGEMVRQRVDIANEFRRAGHFVFSGDVTGLSMADYLLGALRTFDQGTGEYKAFRVTYPAAYFQDDWKIRPRFTLNLGARYEATPPYHETRGRLEVFSPAAYAARVKTSQYANAPFGVSFRGDPGTPEDGTLGDYNNVSARFGFAWDVSGNGKTSLRGGGGMFYNQHQYGEFNNGGVNAPPWSIRLSVTQPQGPFSDPYRGRSDFNLVRVESIGDPNAPFPRPVLVTSYDPRQDTPITYNWNLTLEREVIREWLVRAAYVGSATNNGHAVIQLNPSVYIPGSTLGTDARRLFAPDLGGIEYFTQDRRAYYHSGQLSMTKRFSHGYTLLANYTLSKSLDNNAAFMVPYTFPDADRNHYGRSDFDHRHRLVASWVWDIPKAPVTNSVLKQVVHGWQWSGIGQYQSGAPFTIRSGQDNSRTALGQDRARLTGVSPDAPSGADKRVWFNSAAFATNTLGTFGDLGRNSFYGPNLFSFDMGVFKQFPIRERFNVQFRAEFFNVFNQVNFNNPNNTVTGGGFGTITSTSPSAGDPRIIQFALKMSF
ncbi:MAG: TonB-dependent receptor [Acidobacteria bacterium]|nr:TonB-dependent receptor [Acidobacteriota bacterium]